MQYSPDRTRLLLLLGGLKWVARPVLRLLKGLLSFGLKKRRCVWGGVAEEPQSARPLFVIASIPSTLLLPLASFWSLRLIWRGRFRHALGQINHHHHEYNPDFMTTINTRTRRPINPSILGLFWWVSPPSLGQWKALTSPFLAWWCLILSSP